ncbi:transketolase [Candidatus Uhrbacteria bacterium CG10_big_fil_rev_8_21_14_0_10_48_11]|uniref:Transketolase n=1 Tax=Candidatus Uhrbacteria bacterium CG10_big_fil_rev_8_21_14_0_10_48_11 TaxID=1975037 RepID=A0A2M8LDH2_9BACT|nr:MAG: transketolase [Candidatus Uhrbacteria bacterium CG10_big_fil_rev_8_21_14_0_10_48_11]
MSLSPKAHLHPATLSKPQEEATRVGYGRGLLEAGRRDERVVALSADLTDSTKTSLFAEAYPERFVQVGVAEQNMVTVASGMAAYGKIPFVTSYAMFSPGRNWEQIRTTICYNDVPVKIVGSHAGVSVGPDGATHQAIEDIAIMRVLPNMTVIYPCDANEAERATLAAAKLPTPAYLRLAREKTPVFTTKKTPFKIGRAEVFFASKGKPVVAILATGPLVYEALTAAITLEQAGIPVRVLNVHTIKPLDEAAISKAAKDAGAIVTAEEHQLAGGFGSAVAEVLARRAPTPVEMVGIHDRFGESGSPDALLKKFHLTAPAIAQAARRVIKRKK